MPLTELALLHLKPTITVDNAALQSSLRSAKHAMESFTGYPFHFFTQVEDPSYIYIIGNWTSLTQHVDQWIPSEKNQALLEALENLLTVEWMFHLDIDQLATKEGSEGIMPFSAPIVAIVRHFIAAGKKDSFVATFEKNKQSLVEFTAPQPICGGWRIDREQESGKDGAEKDEFVLFSGWRKIAHHVDFAQTEPFERYKEIRDYLAAFEVKHATRWEI
ncbi:uncharacterized protein CIMG_08995 [Coccidioides immitis RS]|uniref:ABM domain-containing protein n=1 Tax=Coccidioides immitis (strain RS) TaxID=246410 RepID=J3K1E6_COCIM|nr:uncharacterized protein CIMG_08995 [Coccidioides immitis RS]EAS27791.3 hypothetical protein CIMG_08995 [Coccidioides immitis RS]